jgi:hypothetical protein
MTNLSYSHASGSTFPIGTTTVSISATDAAGSSGTGSFSITVAALSLAVAIRITLHDLKLLPNAETAEDDVEDVFDVDSAGDFAEGFGGLAEFQR